MLATQFPWEVAAQSKIAHQLGAQADVRSEIASPPPAETAIFFADILAEHIPRDVCKKYRGFGRGVAARRWEGRASFRIALVSASQARK